MPATHARTPIYAAVYPVFLRTDGAGATSLLLHRRQRTGWMDGRWDLAGSGHVEVGEVPTEALVRECREELGVQVDAAALTFAHVSHLAYPDYTYLNLYFIVGAFTGEPHICEPEKNAKLRWFSLDALPADIIPARGEDLQHVLARTPYSERHQ